MNAIRDLISAVINAAAAKLRGPAPVGPLALPQFAGQHTNPINNERRKVMRAIGKRKFKKAKLRAHFPRTSR